MHKSVWTDQTSLPAFNSLKKDIKTDVLIIGGGICGILCAHMLNQAGVKYILVEGNKIASGITKNTTAKITFQHGLIYSKLEKTVGTEKALMYLTANRNALSEYKKLCSSIDCDFEERDAFTYSLTNRQILEQEIDSLHKLGYDALLTETPELPFKTKGAVCFKNQAQFNPLKFIASIANNLNIYDNTFVYDISPHTAITSGGRITAEKIIVATHFPFINKHGSYFLKLYQHRSYVSAYENAQHISGMYIDESDSGLSFRSYNNLLLIGGSGHRTGKQSGAWKNLNNFAGRYYPEAELKYEWATQDCMSLDKIPYIGYYSAKTPDMYVATGFNKWGMTSSMAAATILTDMVLARKNDYSEVFSPQRSILKSQLIVNGIESVSNLLTPSTKRCPHLGCALKWNKAEHTWDCPCHGSRFEKDGSLIDNPSTGDAHI